MVNRTAVVVLFLAALILSALPALAQSARPGDAYIAPSGTILRVLLDEGNLGRAGFVHAGDQVVHKTPEGEPTRVLVIWVPGGESAGIRASWRHEPVPQDRDQ